MVSFSCADHLARARLETWQPDSCIDGEALGHGGAGIMLFHVVPDAEITKSVPRNLMQPVKREK